MLILQLRGIELQPQEDLPVSQLQAVLIQPE